MRSIFTLALIGAIAYAAQWDDDDDEFGDDIQDDGNDADEFAFEEYDYSSVGFGSHQDQHVDENFNDYLARCGKSYENNREYKKREKLWRRTVQQIEEMNAASTATTFGTNSCTAELTQEEKQARMGADDADINDQEQWTSLTNKCADDDTIVCDSTPIDWVAAGKVHPVKDQSWCGSCWAFTATLALESMVAIETNSDVVRLSEQQGVDCTTDTEDNFDLFGRTYDTLGCDGGVVEYYWNFARDHGAMTNEDYAYTGRDEKCKHNKDQVAVFAGEMIPRWDITDVQQMKDQLADGPFTIGIQATDPCWENYQGGILTYRDQCGVEDLDHTVTVVGCGMETVTFNYKTPDVYETKCKKKKRGKKCKRGEKKRRKNRKVHCCKKTLIEEGEFITETVDQEYWLVQNSWGVGWGENGFIKLGVEGGFGVSGMNVEVEAIKYSAPAP